MTSVLELVEKLGAPLISLGALAFLFKSIRYYEKLRKDLPLSKGEFETWQEEKFEPRIKQIENNQGTFSKEWSIWGERLRIIWNVGGYSNPRQTAVSPPSNPQTVVVREVAYVERVEDIEKPRFRTGEHQVYTPSTEKPPPPNMQDRKKRDAILPRKTQSYDESFDEDSTPPTNPEGSKKK